MSNALKKGQLVYLVFDDYPTRLTDDILIALNGKTQVNATFCNYKNGLAYFFLENGNTMNLPVNVTDSTCNGHRIVFASYSEYLKETQSTFEELTDYIRDNVHLLSLPQLQAIYTIVKQGVN